MRSPESNAARLETLIDEGRRLLRDARLACTDRAEHHIRVEAAAWHAQVLASTGIGPDDHVKLDQTNAFGLEETLLMLQSRGSQPTNRRHRPDDCVFIVHGRDEGRRETVARLVEKLGLRAVILDERPMRGRALLEKFEEEAEEADYAIVIAMPEDRGAGPGDPLPDQPNRARQNVIIEVGYFMGLLGRDRVALLSQAPLELPSDLGGIGYVRMEGDWQTRLARELLAAGMRVDTSRMINP